jgi:hypothetical protein
MIEKKYIGGAKYGFVGATWPFAELKVQNDNIMNNYFRDWKNCIPAFRY